MYLEKAKSTLKLLGKADRFILGYLVVLLYSCMFCYLFTIFSLTLLFASMQYCRGSGNISSRISLEIPLGSPTNFLNEVLHLAKNELRLVASYSCMAGAIYV